MNRPVEPRRAAHVTACRSGHRRELAGWSAGVRQEFADDARDHQVGSVLLSETDEVEVWSIRLAPGERVAAHRHVLNYFWTALTESAWSAPTTAPPAASSTEPEKAGASPTRATSTSSTTCPTTA